MKRYYFETYVTKRYYHEIDATNREEAEKKFQDRDFEKDYNGIKVIDIDTSMVKAEDLEEEEEENQI